MPIHRRTYMDLLIREIEEPASQLIVGISDMKISHHPDHVLVTYSLGSCVGLSLYDPAVHVGGLLHCMLPMSKTDPDKSQIYPCMFVDTGVPALLQAMFDSGASRKTLIAKIGGASNLLDRRGMFRIGERNYAVLRKVLWKNDIQVCGESVGGTMARTMYLCMANGATVVKTQGRFIEL